MASNPHAGTTDLPEALDPSLRGRLQAVLARVRRCVLVEGLAYVLAFVLVAGLAQFAIDYGVRGLRISMRAALLGIIVVSTTVLIWKRLWTPLSIRLSDADAARLVERKFPQLSSLLISAVRFAKGEVGSAEANSPTLASAVIQRAAIETQAVDFGAVLDARRSRRATMFLGCVILSMAGLGLGAPQMTGIWFARNILLQDVAWPKRTTLIVELQDGVLIGARGDDLTVQAHAQGKQPRHVEIYYEKENGDRGRETMVTVGSAASHGYRYTFPNAQTDFEFYLVGGDDQTEVYQARLLDRPRVASSRMTVTPPSYTELSPRVFEDGHRAAQVLPGSEVAIWIGTTKPVLKATLMTGREPIADAEPKEDGYAVSFSPTKTETYHFALVDEVNLVNRKPVRFSLRVVRDEAPRVRLKILGAGDMITVDATLPLQMEFADEYGLAAAELVFRITRENYDETRLPLSGFKPKLTTFSTSLAWSVSELDLIEGERLTLQVRATDFDSINGPNFAQSPDRTFRVVSKEELLAEFARREHEYRMAFERLVETQEQIRGKLLTVLGHAERDLSAASLAAALAPLERRQRNLASSVNVLRQQFAQILSELAINQLDDFDTRERLEGGIIDPLQNLAKRDMIAAADSIRQWSRESSSAKAELVDPLQARLLSQLRAVLARMIQWEGYHEVVNLLRDIVRLQGELTEETKSEVVEQAGDLFDDE